MATSDMNLAAHIKAITEQGYHDLAQENNVDVETVHAQPYCRPMSTILMLGFFERGVDAQVNSRGGRLDEHRYVTIGGDADTAEIVIDPTWQQFLAEEKRLDTLPKVLVGTRTEVIDFAVQSGVSEQDALVWSADHVTLPHKSVHELIADAIDAATV